MTAPVYTNFVAPAIDAGNLNEVNTVIYSLLGDGTNPPANDADIRTNIGLGTMATQSAGAVAITGGTITGITDLAIADGGTGASTAAAARTNLVVAQIGPSFSAERATSAQTIPNSTATEIIFNSELLDTDSAYSTVNGRFTPLVAGKYQVNSSVTVQSAAADISIAAIYIYKNGALYKRGSVYNVAAAGAGSVWAGSVSGQIELNGSTDYVSIFVFVTRSGGPTEIPSTVAFSWFDGHFIRP